LIPEIRQAIVETNERCLDGFSPTEVKQFKTLLSQLELNLRNQPQDTYDMKFIKKDH